MNILYVPEGYGINQVPVNFALPMAVMQSVVGYTPINTSNNGNYGHGCQHNCYQSGKTFIPRHEPRQARIEVPRQHYTADNRHRHPRPGQR